ncbi:hypothetical protein K488DRAFT_49122, partial [Vararia minispora EC-137]
SHGPILIGTIFNVLLYGKCRLYRCKYRANDRWFMKALVLFLFVADTMNSVFDITYTYDSLVNHYSTSTFYPAMVSLVAAAVQAFFTWRVKVLTGNIWLVMLLVLTVVGGTVGGIATSIAIRIVPNWLEFQRFKVPVIVWLVTSAVVDSTITVVLTWNLRRHKTGFQHTDDVLDKIIRLTVQTGLITSIWAIVDLIVFLAIPTGIHLIFNFPLSKLYSNSLLSSLNARGNFTHSGTPTDDWKANRKAVRSPSLPRPQIVRPEVYVNVESHEMSDRPQDDAKAEVFGAQGIHSTVVDIKRSAFDAKQAV